MQATSSIHGDRSPDAGIVYRTSAQVRARYGGVSDMTLWRWLRDEDLAFPQPIRIKGRRLWSEESLAAWERRSQRVEAA